MNTYKHYIRLQDGCIIKGFTDAFECPEPGDICIQEQGGRHFEIKDLCTLQGCAKYKYIDSCIVPCVSQDHITFYTAQTARVSKQSKLKQLKDLTVVVHDNTYDADEASQNRIHRRIERMRLLSLTSVNWKMADNTWKNVTLIELEEALLAAVYAHDELWKS